MTLVAGYNASGIPIIIGDVTLSKGQIRSLRKKIYRISKNLAVGWSGHMVVAQMVIKDLIKYFSNKIVTKESLKEFFLQYDISDFGDLSALIVGCIVDSDAHFFRWNCQYPKELFYDEYIYDGTGEKYFKSIRGRNWQKGSSILPKNDKAILSVLSNIAFARFEESLYRDTWDRSFGISYDVFAYLDGKFKFIDSIVYVGWDYYFDSSKGTGKLEQAPIIIKHINLGDYSIVQESLQGKYYDGVTFNYLARPVYDEMEGADLSNFTLSLRSTYYSNYFLFREKGKVIFKLLLNLQRITSDGPLKIDKRRGAFYLDFDKNELDSIFRRHSRKMQ